MKSRSAREGKLSYRAGKLAEEFTTEGTEENAENKKCKEEICKFSTDKLHVAVFIS